MKKLLTPIKKVLRWPKKYLIGLLLVLLVIGFFATRGAKGETLTYTEVKRGEVKETVVGTGVLTGKDSVSLTFLGGGKLFFVNAKVGQNVVRRQAVAGLDSKDLSLALQQAEADLRQKQASAEKALDDVKGHDSDETYAQKETRTKAEVARDEAVTAVERAKAAISQSVIYAPISGIITEVNYLPGQFVSSANTIAKVVDWSKVYFEAEIDEADIAKIQVDHKAEVTLNAYPDKTFTGLVDRVIPQTKSTSTGGTIVKVRINLGNPSVTLIDGLNGQASVVLNQHTDTLVIPRDALREDNRVIVKEGKEFKVVEVTQGIESDYDMEIVSGLSEGQTIVTNPQAYKERKGFFFWNR